MFNTTKISVDGCNEYSPEPIKESIPLFIPDNQGPWAIRYIWMKNQDSDFIKKYYSLSDDGAKANVRKSSSHLKDCWVPHNCLLINQGHLGNIVWRIKTGNPFNDSIDIIEVWRSRQIVEDLFDFNEHDEVEIEFATTVNPEVRPATTELSQGGTGLKNGSGLTVSDPDAPRVFKKEHGQQLATGLLELGFDIRSWKEYPLISKAQAINLYKEFESRSRQSNKITINTGWNSKLNPL